MTYCISTVCS